MRLLPSALAPAGYSPARLNPLSPAPVADQGQRLTDLMAIQRLFANGEQGGYWPADPAYLYEDSAGTIPASVNGVVGLWLDVSKRLELGPELVANGGFNVDTTGWTVNASGALTIEDGSLRLTNVSGESTCATTISTQIGKFYRFSYTLKKYIANSVFRIGTGFGLQQNYSSGLAGNQSVIVPVTAATTYLSLNQNNSTLGYYSDIDNVSAKQIFGSHAIQATTGNKPYLRKTPVSNKFWLDSNTATGALTATFASSLGSACTIATVGAEGVTIADNQTVGTTYNLCPPYGYNGDVLIINRALTAVEKALVKRVMVRNVPVLSASILSNGGFDSDTQWTKGIGWTIANGVATFATGTNSYLHQSGWLVGKIYSINFDVVAYSGANPAVSVYAGQSPAFTVLQVVNSTLAVKSYKYAVTCPASSSVVFYGNGVAGASIDFDNYNAREIL